jgi:YegS/Rv2252/BmrU family lipid kinase
VRDKKRCHHIRACLIVSPRSGHGRFDVSQALPVLQAHCWEVAVREKHAKGEAEELAREAAADGYDPIVNCGGDGTLNEIVEALAGMDVAVGTIPGGTANVWSKQVTIAQRTRVAATQLVASRRVRVDVGRVEINGHHKHHFLMMAGLGADAVVMAGVSRSLKNRLGPLAVGVAAARAIPSLRSAPVQVEMDGVQWEGRVTQVILGNTRLYGGFTQITPEAYADDGLLDACIFTTGGIVGTAQQMTSMVLRQQPHAASAELYRAARVVVDTPSVLPLQIDGSVVHQKGIDESVRYVFSVMPHGLTVLVPRTYDGAILERGMPDGHRAPKNRQGKGNKKGR